MKSNFRYKIYKFYSRLKSKLANGSTLSRLFVRVMSWAKDFAVRAYVFYVSRITYFVSLSLFEIYKEDFVNEVSASPKDIKFHSSHFPEKQNKPRSVRGGNWDTLDQRIENLEACLAICEAFTGEKPIENSNFFQKMMTGFESGESFLGCRDKQSFLSQWQELLNLFANREAINEVVMEKYLSKWEPVQIDIGRHGDLLLSHGDLSLIIAKLFDLQTVPVTIRTRHTKWVIFRKRFQDLVTTVGSKAYQPPLHPDLMYIPAEQSCVERYEIIKRNLSFTDGNLLELGANAGFFSIKFENDGFNCVAVESFPGFVFCLRGQRRSLNKTFKIIPVSFLDRKDILDQEFNVVLALNVLSHLTVHKDDFEKLNYFLENLKCKEMFFEPYSPTDPQMKNAYVNMNEDEFADYVREKLRLSRVDLIGRASDKRRLYKIF
jgi:hypothetical protein